MNRKATEPSLFPDPGFMDRPTVGGHRIDVVASLLQKAIRRGLEEDALWAATELDLSGLGNYAWKRLRVITSEDVGLAEPTMPAVIAALNDSWTRQKPRDGSERLYLVHAVILLTRARKSRLVDNALMTFFEGDRPKRVIPDWALDMHTLDGRQLGRGLHHFFATGAQLENQGDIADPHAGRGRQARLSHRIQGKTIKG
jgi:replication-associated recombination protein RarA